MTRRHFLLTLILLSAFSVQALANPLPLIVQISPTASITNIATTLGATLVDTIPGANIHLLNVPVVPSSLTASSLGIEWMELNTGVTLPGFIQVGILTVPGTTVSDWYKYQPSMQLIRAGAALPYSTGQAVVVADINSQVDYAHPALVGHLTSGYDFVTTRPAGSTALNQAETGFLDQAETGFLDSETGFMNQFGAGILDYSQAGSLYRLNPAYSHGTLCAGVIAAIAPASMIMPLRVFDDVGRSDIFTIAKAIRYAVQHGAQVINMSFGTLTPSPALGNAINYARNADVTMAASAGNNNTSNPQYPAALSGVLTTAATDLLDWKASFSNYGSSVFVTAPGVKIFSAYPGGYYSIVSGTSFSAPMVAGTAALIRSLRATGVSTSISAGSVNIDSRNPGYVNQLGYGRIDVRQAVNPN
jgi:subtilisin family serine protease